jgi:hypothetical protein
VLSRPANADGALGHSVCSARSGVDILGREQSPSLGLLFRDGATLLVVCHADLQVLEKVFA